MTQEDTILDDYNYCEALCISASQIINIGRCKLHSIYVYGVSADDVIEVYDGKNVNGRLLFKSPVKSGYTEYIHFDKSVYCKYGLFVYVPKTTTLVTVTFTALQF